MLEPDSFRNRLLIKTFRGYMVVCPPTINECTEHIPVTDNFCSRTYRFITFLVAWFRARNTYRGNNDLTLGYSNRDYTEARDLRSM